MSYTNKTTHYEFPQYVGTDIPSILTDLNETYEAIDEAIYAVASKQSGDEADITALQSQVSTQGVEIAQNTTNLANEITARQNADTALDTRVSTNENNITSLQSNVSSLGTRVTTAESKIGTGTLDTVAQTLVGAVNEIVGELPSGGSTEEKQTATLTAGQTSKTLTFTEQTIGATTLVLPFTSEFGVNPTNVTVTASTVVMTFNALDHDITVGALVKN